jgi:hypothetical protein
MKIDNNMTKTLITAKIRASDELSGYSNKSQTFFCNGFMGNGFSSSLMQPSSSLKI